jgi:integrase
VKHRFTVHGLRYTFTDLIRLSTADAVVRRALTGHVTQEMQQHYSNVGTEEKRAAIAGALKLLANTNAGQSVNSGVNRGGPEEVSAT